MAPALKYETIKFHENLIFIHNRGATIFAPLYPDLVCTLKSHFYKACLNFGKARCLWYAEKIF